MANGIRTGDPRGFNEGPGSKFREGSRVRQTPEEVRRTYRPKRCGNNNQDDSPKNLNDKNLLLITKCQQNKLLIDKKILIDDKSLINKLIIFRKIGNDNKN